MTSRIIPLNKVLSNNSLSFTLYFLFFITLSNHTMATDINFWNGNKTAARQSYELDLLKRILSATEDKYGQYALRVDTTNYPTAEGEGSVFEKGSDVIVTVAGNVKFANKDKIVIRQGITKGLLGYRLAIIRNDSIDRFKNLKHASELQKLSIGIPETWADAELFRQNDYKVVEKGSYDDLFHLLKNKAFDYTALGANEIEEAVKQRAEPLGGLSIDQSIIIYYPFPLVFYVNGGKPELAKRIESGLNKIIASGEFDRVFDQYHGDIVKRLHLKERKIFRLSNPALPKSMADFKGTLLD